MTSIMVSPPHPVLLIMDPGNDAAVIPESMDGKPVAATSSCVAVGTQASVDGETAVSLVFGSYDPPGELSCVFDGSVLTPQRKLAVLTSELKPVIERNVGQSEVRISIWVDDLENPAQVIVHGGPDSVAA
jgi:hypothetical protein